MYAIQGLWQASYAWFMAGVLQLPVHEIALAVGAALAIQAAFELPSGAAAQKRAHTPNLVAIALLAMASYAALFAIAAVLVASFDLTAIHPVIFGGALVAEVAFGFAAAVLTGTIENWAGTLARAQTKDLSIANLIVHARYFWGGIASCVFGIASWICVGATPADSQPLLAVVLWSIAAVGYLSIAAVVLRSRPPRTVRPRLRATVTALLTITADDRGREAIARHAARTADYFRQYPRALELFTYAALATGFTWLVDVLWVTVGTLAVGPLVSNPEDHGSTTPMVVAFIGIISELGTLAATYSTEPTRELGPSRVAAVGFAIFLVALAACPFLPHTISGPMLIVGIIGSRSVGAGLRSRLWAVIQSTVTGDRAVLLSAVALMRAFACLPLFIGFGLLAMENEAIALVTLAAAGLCLALALLQTTRADAASVAPGPSQTWVTSNNENPPGPLQASAGAIGATALAGVFVAFNFLYSALDETAVTELPRRALVVAALGVLALAAWLGWRDVRRASPTVQVVYVVSAFCLLMPTSARAIRVCTHHFADTSAHLVRVSGVGANAEWIVSLGDSKELRETGTIQCMISEPVDEIRIAGPADTTVPSGAYPAAHRGRQGLAFDVGEDGLGIVGPLNPSRLQCWREVTGVSTRAPVPLRVYFDSRDPLRARFNACVVIALAFLALFVQMVLTSGLVQRFALTGIRSSPRLHALRVRAQGANQPRTVVFDPDSSLRLAEAEEALLSDLCARLDGVSLVIGGAMLVPRRDDRGEDEAAYLWTYAVGVDPSGGKVAPRAPVGPVATGLITMLWRRALESRTETNGTRNSASLTTATGCLPTEHGERWRARTPRRTRTAGREPETLALDVEVQHGMVGGPGTQSSGQTLRVLLNDAEKASTDEPPRFWAGGGVWEPTRSGPCLSAFALLEVEEPRHISRMDRATLESVAWAALAHTRLALDRFLSEERAHLAAGMASTAHAGLGQVQRRIDTEDCSPQVKARWTEDIELVRDQLQHDAMVISSKAPADQLLSDLLREFVQKGGHRAGGIKVEPVFKGRGLKRVFPGYRWVLLRRILLECVENARKHGRRATAADAVVLRCEFVSKEGKVTFTLANEIGQAQAGTGVGLDHMAWRVANDLEGTWFPPSREHGRYTVRFSIPFAEEQT